MIIIRHINEMQQKMLSLRGEGKTIGYVPTMGYLHEGHQSLVTRAKAENDVVAMSVFVNPLQFGPNEDFDRYPRDFKHDEQVAKKAGVDILFYPEVKEMYPHPLSLTMNVKDRIHVLCGRTRVGHFDGVITVLTKLFHIVMPHRAYFGMKDAQQVAVVEGLVEDLNFPLAIVRCAIVREEDGLAKSSRNVYLTEQERKEAVHLSKSLQMAKSLVEQGERSPKEIERVLYEYIQTHTSGKVDYAEVLTYPGLQVLSHIQGEVIVAVAVRFSNVRLIDNVTFTIGG